MIRLDQPALFQHDAVGSVGPDIKRQKEFIRHRQFPDIPSGTKADILLCGVLDQVTAPKGFTFFVHGSKLLKCMKLEGLRYSLFF